ncbi:ABC transporter ATP-binding protein [Aminipila butyrica]|uniref:ABC transporter ATP-binding protein n=1 Tax=Aminipila butyrica TaxID=433296 RepID=A0A858BUE9_9FIRM|nr:ABC transporter ATP-binding protein [Aminipila butyrica]QIB68819.1 ABC transporter ATP-binding protein [Aminipila butyrica]
MNKPKKTSQKILYRLKRYRLLLAASILFATITVGLSLYVPILVGRCIDLILGPGQVDFPAIYRLLPLILISVGAGAILQWLMNIINNRITFQVIRDVRGEAFEKIESLPLKYLDAHAHGEIVSRVIADVDQFADGLLLGFTQLFTGVITILGTLLFMFSINWRIAWVVVLLTPISLLVARFIARKTYYMFQLQSETRGQQTSLIDEMIQHQKVVQAFSHQEENLHQFDEINERLAEYYQKATFFSSITNPATRFINSMVYAGVGLVGALSCIGMGGVFTVGQLACFLSYASQYTKPFNEISGVITELQNALACAARVFEIIEEEPQTPDSASAVSLETVQGNVTLNQVAFSYTPTKRLIENFNLSVAPGQRIAIVGPTGCGKTTIINLLMRFYDVDSGSIQVEGKDIREVTRQSLRSSYGMVLQDTWLRSGTIRENIAMGKPQATDQEIVNAAKTAHAHSFIKRLPQGYDTLIGQDGGGLSQGQKQLLCIARVMLCQPPMLILDEATSSIDTRTELKIQNAFAWLMEGRTSFIVAHRLSTIREADVILVMQEGNIIEQGRHEELLKQQGFYAQLYNSQFSA